MTVADIVTRLLAYADFAPGETLPKGSAEWLVDAIGGAVSEMAALCPRYFETRQQGYFLAPAAVNVTPASGGLTVAAATSGILNVLSTLRIAGGDGDFQVETYAHPTANITPAWTGAVGSVIAATAFHDAVAATVRLDGAATVEVNGRELRRVASRFDAFDLCGMAGQGVNLDTGTSADGAPSVWWPERTDTANYVCVYPMPAARMGFSIRGSRVINTLGSGGVLTDTTTYGIEDAVARDIWLPLATKRWANCPLMANSAVREEIARQAAVATEHLLRLGPKRRQMEPWNSRMPTRHRVSPNTW